MDNFTGPGREHVDHLPILISGQNVVKLLSIPNLHDGTAATISQAVMETMNEWDCRTTSRVCASILQLQTLEQKVEFAFGWRLRLATSY